MHARIFMLYAWKSFAAVCQISIETISMAFPDPLNCAASVFCMSDSHNKNQVFFSAVKWAVLWNLHTSYVYFLYRCRADLVYLQLSYHCIITAQFLIYNKLDIHRISTCIVSGAIDIICFAFVSATVMYHICRNLEQ